MATCVLCGCEVGFLGQKVVHLCSTEQILCGDCWKRYNRADNMEQPRLRDQIIASPHLRKREQVQDFLAANKASIERREREREEAQKQADFLEQHMRKVLRCCDQPMDYLGPGTYTQISENLLTPAFPRRVSVFECPVCGQVKFFNEGYIPTSLRKKEETNG